MDCVISQQFSLRWDETRLVAVGPTSLQLPIDTNITTGSMIFVYRDFVYKQCDVCVQLEVFKPR